MGLSKSAIRGITLILLVLITTTPISRATPRVERTNVDKVRTFGAKRPTQLSKSEGIGTLDRISCVTTGNPLADIDISCDQTYAPDDELAIVVDPENPDHLLAGSNDYVFYGHFVDHDPVPRLVQRHPTGFFVSFDGGTTWTDGQIPLGDAEYGGDPSPAFNAKFDSAHMANLSFVCAEKGGTCTRGNIQVVTSHDGGLTWEKPVTVHRGFGSDRAGREIFNDKEWLIADNYPSSPFYGRLYLVWAKYYQEKGVFKESPITFSYSDDAGLNWSTPQEISGRDPQYCTFQDDVSIDADPYECDQSQLAYPTIAADGTVYVHFTNEQNAAAWETGEAYESQIMVVRSHDGGATWTQPVHVVQLEDGYTGRDYPLNIDGRTTLTGHQLRVHTGGNIAVDASNGPNKGRLYIVFTDNADGLHDVATPVTDINVFLAFSDDGGSTWVGGDTGQTNTATRVRIDSTPASDQWFPWAAVDPVSGALKVLYMDGRPDRELYDISLAVATGTPLMFSKTVISQAPSNPDQDLWFGAGVPGCEFCSTFIGDYNGLTIDTLSRTHGVWIDMRQPLIGDLRNQDAYYARR